MPRCTSCGAWVDEGTQFCDHCGVKVPEDAPGDRWGKGPVGELSPEDEAEEREIRQRAREREREEVERRPPQRREPPFEFVLRHPLRRGRELLVISATLALGSVFVLPALVLLGYSHRLGRSVAFEEETPPTYGDWRALLGEGASTALVVGIPSLLWLVGTAVVAGLLLFALPFAGGLGVLVAGFSLLGLLWFTGAYAVAFVGSDSVAGAFLDGRARRLLSGDEYLKLWLLLVLIAVPVLVALLVLAGPLYVLVALDVPVVAVALFLPLVLAGLAVTLGYATLVGATYAGYVYYRMADSGTVPPPEERRRTPPKDQRPDPAQ